jgi:hypothetical protein
LYVTQQARQNHKDEMDFTLQCMMFIFCNELPEADPVDTFETLDNFIFRSKFVSKQVMDEVKELQDDGLSFFKLRDDDIKDFIKEDYVLDAFTSIIFDHYMINRPAMPEIMMKDNKLVKGENEESIELVCAKIFQSTPDESAIMSSEDVLDKVKAYTKNSDINDKKLKTTLASLQLGVHGRYTVNKKKFMGYKFIKVREAAETVIAENDADIETE